VRKLVLVLATFLYTPAHADTVTIRWWDKSIGGSVITLSASLARSLRPAQSSMLFSIRCCLAADSDSLRSSPWSFRRPGTS
jgi:hypothetical protein